MVLKLCHSIQTHCAKGWTLMIQPVIALGAIEDNTTRNGYFQLIMKFMMFFRPTRIELRRVNFSMPYKEVCTMFVCVHLYNSFGWHITERHRPWDLSYGPTMGSYSNVETYHWKLDLNILPWLMHLRFHERSELGTPFRLQSAGQGQIKDRSMCSLYGICIKE